MLIRCSEPIITHKLKHICLVLLNQANVFLIECLIEFLLPLNCLHRYSFDLLFNDSIEG